MKLRLKPAQMLSGLISRFAPSALICALLALCGIASDAFLYIRISPDAANYTPFTDALSHVSAALGMALFFATAASCLCERYGWRRFIAWICAAVGAAAGAYLYLTDDALSLAAGLCLSCLALCLHSVDDREHPGVRLAQVCGWFFVSLGVSLVLYLALALCCSALFDLIVESAASSARSMVSVSIAYLTFFLFAPWLFLGGLPGRDTPTDRPSGFRKLTSVVLLPLYLLLLGILLLYVAKIAVTFTMPVGVMNGYALAALTLFVFFHLILTGDENRLSSLFLRWGALPVLPVIAAQAVGVWMRVSAYGLTEARVLGLVWTVLCVAAVVCALLRRRAGWFFPAAALIALVILSTPLSAGNIALWNQESRLSSALTRNGMLDQAGRIVPGPDASDADREVIYSSLLYLEEEDSREGSLISRLLSQEEALRETHPNLSPADRRAELLGFPRPGEDEGWYHRKYVFSGSASTTQLDTRGIDYAELITIQQWNEDTPWLFDKTDAPSDTRCGLADLPALTAALNDSFGSDAPVNLSAPVVLLIDGEEIDIAPLLNGLLLDKTETDLTDDRLALPSGQTLHVHEISVHDYSSDDSMDSLSFTAWLLTPEA